MNGYFIPWWGPIAFWGLVGAVVFDKLTGTRVVDTVADKLEKDHKKQIDKQFGWDK
jgi:hypothetical protein